MEKPTQNIKDIIIECLEHKSLDKLYHIIMEYFHTLDHLDIDKQFRLRSSNLVECILDAYRYNSDYDIYTIIGKMLSHPKIDDDDIMWCVLNKGESNKLKDVIKNNSDKINIVKLYEKSINNNNTIITKFLIEEYDIDPTLKNNLALYCFAESYNVKMVRYLAKRKDVRKLEKMSEQEIIKKFAY